MAARKVKKLKPAGHSAAIEALVQPAIVIASTLMSAIAAYVLASDELADILAGKGTPVDWFIVALCVGLGFLVDMAIIVSATRYKMHAVRGDPSEKGWKRLSVAVLVLGLGSESMTLLYFFVHNAPASAFPGWLVSLAEMVHSVLAVSRAFMPPVIVAYFAAGVLPVVIERSDRNREIKSRTSQDIATLVDRLAEVEETDDKEAMLKALGGLLALNTYASYDTEAQLTEDEQVTRDDKLLGRLAQLHGMDWSRLQVVKVTPAEISAESSTGGEAFGEGDQPRRSLAPVYADRRRGFASVAAKPAG
jgi:hypothetical protein